MTTTNNHPDDAQPQPDDGPRDDSGSARRLGRRRFLREAIAGFGGRALWELAKWLYGHFLC
ncbi:hypothetical protein RE9431_49520 (plasmid) [Prescottella equi]|uniref:Uncharacterized protein n=1 Tax=Rhodococcus hoagii TaxID=43767 RepID=A0A1Z1UWN2_RHOHA|nr:hypothetical protein pVAPN1354_00145 [Prescottella equi]ARX60039.1 hypothetical protein pVAPN1557_1441 [Prescottella equi]BCN46695.1 hypothetical protein RE9414_49750 [Prescottella equi]BCN66497.1 hypothetical protein RE9431_49520 [Prescottella equi]BCN71397.1 hypothetical protein RE943_48700 [Prescottella equi]